MTTLDSVRDLLGKHEYLPVVRQVGTGCILSIPPPLLTNPDALPYHRGYAPGGGGFLLSCSINPAEQLVEVPAYAVRLLIYLDVVRLCEGAGIDRSLLLFLDQDGDEVTSLDQVLAGGPDRATELRLLALFRTAVDQDFHPAIEEAARRDGVLEGYQACCSLLKG